MIAIEWSRAAGAPTHPGKIGPALAVVGGLAWSEFPATDALFAATDRSGSPPAAVGACRILFDGYIDNAREIALELGLPPATSSDFAALGRLYGAAVQRWGRTADLRLIGEYAAIVLDPVARELRLSRSPLRAPPLHYHSGRDRVIAASAVRVIFACGVARSLDYGKLADHALFNFTNEAQGWWQGIARVPLGAIVELTPARDDTFRYYDFGAIPEVRRRSVADYVAEAGHLFTAATEAALADSARPAVMLSGGLDSSLVAAKMLEVLPGEGQLDAHCLVPAAAWDGIEPPGRYGDERPLVEALAALHPRLRPQFHDNPGLALDADFSAMFEATGAAPINLVNLGGYHPIWRAARAAGCDRIVLGELGNVTLSNAGDWAFSEWFAGLRWGRLAHALRDTLDDDRPLWRRFAGTALLPWIPDSLWHWQRRVRGRIDIFAGASPLRPDYARASGALERAAAAGAPVRRHPLRDRMADFRAIHYEAWGEFSDTYHGFAQIYGIEQRDPMAWRPLLEFCARIPSDLFVRDGQRRWLARELGKGVLPDAVRLNRRKGLHQPDWHSRLGRQRARLLSLLGAMERVPQLAEMIDFARIRPVVESWPASDAIGERDQMVLESALPRAILLGRFVAWAEGIAFE